MYIGGAPTGYKGSDEAFLGDIIASYINTRDFFLWL